jgi:D-alanine-D-alanine ligase
MMAKAIKTRNKKLIEVLGPVDNLESYVKSDWWRHLFNADYLRTDGDVVEDKDITTHEVDTFLAALGTDPDSHILDLCCGQGRHALEIAKQGYKNVVGLDRSHYLIDRTRPAG